ncbi:Alpha/beta-Hydrolases superfamily protein isoform 3 [Theobroma cacao]|uniref:Alpha/beta-Hydrolases superfamily protein isoform 3 n=1 Tax=Theobroma cacao TaxID=3641 RepID=A0A061G3A1_THECC|nr:Alpha/beta-Hydrolases superfamily protein isoform 3 [Theobroma cacao]
MICSTTGTIVIPRETKFQKFPFKHSHFQVKTYVCSKTNYKPKSRFKDFNPLISTTTKTMAVEPFTSGASGRINALFSLRALRSLMMLVNAIVLLLLLPFRGQKRAVAINSGEKVGKDEKQESGRKGSAVVRVPAAMVPWRSGAVTVDQEAAARRALAIRRVVQDDDDDTVREFSLFVNARGETLFTQSWTPISVIVRGLVVLLHGLNEHSGRYNDFAKQLNANGLKVYGMDWIGHGGSDGLHVLAPVISFLLPRYQVSIANKKGMPVSRDAEALLAKYSDPLVYTGSIRVRTGYEILRITSYLQQNMNRLSVPFLVLHGTDDTVTDPQASQKLYEEASSTDKTIKLFEGLLHDLLFEPERETIMNDIIQWLNCRV